MKHPDFNEWLKTPDGISCNDYNSLSGSEYLKNRLFWAFDAGRNCVWDQYLEQKQRIDKLEEALKGLLIILDSSNNISNGYTLFITNDDSKKIEKAKSLLK